MNKVSRTALLVVLLLGQMVSSVTAVAETLAKPVDSDIYWEQNGEKISDLAVGNDTKTATVTLVTENQQDQKLHVDLPKEVTLSEEVPENVTYNLEKNSVDVDTSTTKKTVLSLNVEQVKEAVRVAVEATTQRNGETIKSTLTVANEETASTQDFPIVKTAADEGLPVSLINGNFESPQLDTNSVVIMDQDKVPGWRTTADDKAIEIANGTGGGHRFRPHGGAQWAEINANEPGQLYQEISTEPGSVYYWELWHAGRDQTDTMGVNIGTKENHTREATFSSPNREWTKHSGFYTVPEGQTVTFFGFESVSSLLPSYGNYIDDIVFKKYDPKISLSKEVDKAKAKVGETLTYTIHVKNEQDLGGFWKGTINDKISSEYLSLVPGTTLLDGASVDDKDAWTDEHNLAIKTEVKAGEQATIQFQVKVLPGAEGKAIKNVATGVGENPRVNIPPTNEVITNIDYPQGEIEASKVSDVKDVKKGDTVTYTIETKNVKEKTKVENVVVADNLPEGIELVDGSVKLDGNAVTNETTDKNAVKVTIPELINDADSDTHKPSAQVSFEVIVTSDVDGAIKNTAEVTDPNDPNNPKTPSTEINIIDSLGELEATKVANKKDVVKGDKVTYTIAAKNIKAGTTVKNAVVEDNLPAGIELIKGSIKVDGKAVENEAEGNAVKVKLPEVKGEATVSVTFDVTVTQAKEGAIKNTAKVTDPNDPNNPKTPSTEIFVSEVPAKLEATKTASKSRVNKGDRITYTIEVANVGDEESLAKDVVVEDKLPAGLKLVPGTVRVFDDLVENEATGNVVKVTLPELHGGEYTQVSFDVIVEGTDKDEITNVATVTDPNNPGNPLHPKTSITIVTPPTTPNQPNTPNKQLPKTGSEKATTWTVVGFAFIAGFVGFVFYRRRNA